MEWKGARDGRDWIWATIEPLCVRGSGFLLHLGAVAGNRSQGSTWDCAHSSPLPSLSLSHSASPSVPLPLLAVFTLLSSSCLHLPPHSSHCFLSCFVFVSCFCPFFPLLPHFFTSSLSSRCHLILLSSLWLVSSHRILTATTGELRSTETKALMKRVAIIFYRLLVVLSDVPNYLNAKLDLVPALWPLLPLIIHFCKKELCSKHWQTNTDTKSLPWQ